MNIPRPEYPRPQFVRKDWMNLNGEWQFEIDHGGSGRARGLVNKEKLDGEITIEKIHFKPFTTLVLKNTLIIDKNPALGQIITRSPEKSSAILDWLTGLRDSALQALNKNPRDVQAVRQFDFTGKSINLLRAILGSSEA